MRDWCPSLQRVNGIAGVAAWLPAVDLSVSWQAAIFTRHAV